MEIDKLSYPEHLRGLTIELLKNRHSDELGLSDWKITDRSLTLGTGQSCFDNATERLLSWQAHKFAGVKATQSENTVQLKFGPTTSYCLILTVIREHCRTTLVYGTLEKHVECGEEAFSIELGDDGSVVGRCVAFSKPQWLLARIGYPLARATQLYITGQYLVGMREASLI